MTKSDLLSFPRAFVAKENIIRIKKILEGRKEGGKEGTREREKAGRKEGRKEGVLNGGEVLRPPPIRLQLSFLSYPLIQVVLFPIF